MKKQESLQIGDGWWNKYIENTGLVESPTMFCSPHWQCKLCEFNHKDIITMRFHVQREHKDMLEGVI